MNKPRTTQVFGRTYQTADIVGVCAGVLLVLLLVIGGIVSALSHGSAFWSVGSDAQTLYGSAQGKMGEVKVKVVASQDKIYRIDVIGDDETFGIGNYAVEKVPAEIYSKQSLKVDAVSGATMTSEAIRQAVFNALESGGIDPFNFNGSKVAVNHVATKVKTGVGVQVKSANDWREQYPEVYASYMRNSENSDTVDYLVEHPMLKVLYEDYGFSKFYSSARGHYYDIKDVTETGRPHALANCFTCKTPNFTAKVNELGDAAYSISFADMQREVNEGISCYNCHANDPKDGNVTVTHTYLTNGVGADFEKIDAANLACGQCHVEYYFAPDTKATTLPHNSLESMSPDAILKYYNEDLIVDGQPFADYTNPRTGVRQIKVQHPEFETYLGEGSVHRGTFTCADCHMANETAADGTVYKSHFLSSPLDNQELIDNTCSKCHSDLQGYVKGIQKKVEGRTDEVGNKLVDLTEKLAVAVKSGNYTEAELNEIRSLARDAQFYWDFVFVENSNGAHNSTLTYDCLDKADALASQALKLFK